MVIVEIPTSARNERFNISLLGVAYQLTMHWCNANSTWILDIADSEGVPMVNGIPVIPGVDLLAQHQHLGIGGRIFAAVDGDAAAIPDFDGMGTTGHLYFVTD